MEKIIHFTVPEKMTPTQAQTIERARALHQTWEVKVWQDPIRRDGYLLERYWTKVNSGAQLSDLLRIDILYKWGGVYVDADLRLLKSLDGLADKFDFFVATADGMGLEGALIGARKAHPAIKTLIEELLSNEPDWSLSPDRTTGPEFLARTLKWNRDITVLPRETFYSYNWFETHSRRTHRHSYGEHLWVCSWKEVDRAIVTPARWRSGAMSLIKTAKRLVKPALISGIRTWRRIISLDRLASEESKFYAVCGEIVVKTVHGFNIVVDGKDTSVSPDLIFGGYELAEEKFVKRILCGGDWAIDVGANVGNFCMLAAQCVGMFGRVFAYEPNPRSRRLLSKSVVMNWMFDRILTRPVAVGETAGSVRLAFIPENLGGAQVGHDEILNSIFNETVKTIGSEHLTVIDVPCVTLDQEFPNDLPIKFLKIDVEGYEASVLKGARRLLERRCIDFILIEVLREVAGSRWSELLVQLNWLTESNYIACTLAADGSLVEHKSMKVALDKLEGRNIVLMARDQYVF
jgi:FkbM family methyltransferase